MGLNLSELLKRNKKHFSLKSIVSLGICLVNLLETFHKAGYVHCDLKPDNIMIGDYKSNALLMNEIYLIDFGVSQKYHNANG